MQNDAKRFGPNATGDKGFTRLLQGGPEMHGSAAVARSAIFCRSGIDFARFLVKMRGKVLAASLW